MPVCGRVLAASGSNANAAAATAKAEIGSARAPGVIAETAHDLTRGSASAPWPTAVPVRLLANGSPLQIGSAPSVVADWQMMTTVVVVPRVSQAGSWLSRRGSQPEARAHRTRPLRLAWPSWQATRASGLALRPACLPAAPPAHVEPVPCLRRPAASAPRGWFLAVDGLCACSGLDAALATRRRPLRGRPASQRSLEASLAVSVPVATAHWCPRPPSGLPCSCCGLTPAAGGQPCGCRPSHGGADDDLEGGNPHGREAEFP